MDKDIKNQNNKQDRLDKCVIIAPQTDLKEKAKSSNADFVFDAAAIQKAEKALEKLSENFDEWVGKEVEKLDQAKDAFIAYPQLPENISALSRASHDLKGNAKTFGYPLISEFCISLCSLIENQPANFKIPEILVQQHVDSIKAILKQGIKTSDNETALKTLGKLKMVTNEYIQHARKQAKQYNDF